MSFLLMLLCETSSRAAIECLLLYMILALLKSISGCEAMNFFRISCRREMHTYTLLLWELCDRCMQHARVPKVLRQERLGAGGG